MTKIDNVTKEIWKYLNSDPIIKRGIARGIINKRALALYLIKEQKLKVNINAVISAIRRFEDDNPLVSYFKKSLDVISNSTMSSKNGIVSLSLEKDVETERILPKLFNIIEIGKHQVLRIIQADESVKIIIDKKNLKKAQKIIPENKIIKIDSELAEVTIHLDSRVWATPGIASVLTSELSMNNVNIVEIMSCIPEIIIFFKEKDLMQAYNILYSFSKEKN